MESINEASVFWGFPAWLPVWGVQIQLIRSQARRENLVVLP